MANVQTMDASGNWTGMYYWFNETEYNGKVVPSGWFDVDGVEPANISLNPGEAVFFYSDQDSAGIQTSGNVTVGEIKQAVANGWTLIGNATPTTIEIDNLKVTGAPDQMANIQTMDASGNMTGMYYWYNETEYNGQVVPAGWFDVDGVEPAAISLEAGESVFFSTDQDGVSVTIPAAL